MAIRYEPSQEHRENQAARIGKLFNLPDAGMQIAADGVQIQDIGGGIKLLRVELVKQISEEEATAILSGTPINYARVSAPQTAEEVRDQAIETINAQQARPRDVRWPEWWGRK
jgi:hypothetical protein